MNPQKLTQFLVVQVIAIALISVIAPTETAPIIVAMLYGGSNAALLIALATLDSNSYHPVICKVRSWLL